MCLSSNTSFIWGFESRCGVVCQFKLTLNGRESKTLGLKQVWAATPQQKPETECPGLRQAFLQHKCSVGSACTKHFRRRYATIGHDTRVCTRGGGRDKTGL